MKSRFEPTIGSLQSSSPSVSLRQAPQTTTRRQQYLLLVDGEIRELTDGAVDSAAKVGTALLRAAGQRPSACGGEGEGWGVAACVGGAG